VSRKEILRLKEVSCHSQKNRIVLKQAIRGAQNAPRAKPDQVPEGRSATGLLLGFETSQDGHNLPIRKEDSQTWRRGLYA